MMSSSSSSRNAVVAFCYLVLLSLGVTSGFHHNNNIVRPSTCTKEVRRTEKLSSRLQQAASSDQRSGNNNNNNNNNNNKKLLVDRRSVLKAKLFTSAVTTAAVALYSQQKASLADATTAAAAVSNQIGANNNGAGSNNGNKNRLLSLDQAFMVIEASCDRRFLHAVISSDYNLMYRGIDKKDSRFPTIMSEPSDLLLPSTYDSKEAAAYFQNLDDTIMADKPIRPSVGHLATTNVEAAKQWGGYAASIWPLDDNVHFAWVEDGGDFWPTTKASSSSSSSKIIVDGVDCGRMSLEDALERESSEIMFKADRYLLIPVSMEQQLISRLQSSFII